MVVVAVTALLTAATVVYIAVYLRNRPPTVPASATVGEASLVLQTVGQLGFGPRSNWVSYLVRQPDGSWKQSTIFELPAHSTIHVTVFQYDSQTGLRNPFFGRTQGLVGGTMTVDGKQLAVLDPAQAAHTFTVADLGISVPLRGIADDASNPCQVAPCTEDHDHETVQFTFRTGAPGTLRWQCLVPCAAGFLNGNGGPMQTIGFMDGWLHWFVLAGLATPAVVLLWGPHLPPGDATVQARHQQQINTILAGIVTPIVLGILVYGIYALVAFRDRGGPEPDGPPIRGDRRVMTAWIGVTVAIVVCVVSYGTADWIGSGVGSGSAQGPAPIARPDHGRPLEVQVIGQQWQWTFRWPSYGGLETPQLVVPSGRYIEFHVTSLDVIHSFWAIELGVKADAVPGADNVVFVRPNRPRAFQIRCAELWCSSPFSTRTAPSSARSRGRCLPASSARCRPMLTR